MKNSLQIVLLFISFTLLVQCKGGGKEQKFLKDPDDSDLRRISSLLHGHWKKGSGNGIQFKLSGSLKGTRGVYTYEGNKKTAVNSRLAPVQLKNIQRESAIVFKSFPKDTLFIEHITEHDLVVNTGKKMMEYDRHEEVSW